MKSWKPLVAYEFACGLIYLGGGFFFLLFDKNLGASIVAFIAAIAIFAVIGRTLVRFRQIDRKYRLGR